MAKDNHISYRGTKGNEAVKVDLKKIADKADRSLNYVVEQALLEYIKRNKK
jgi:predicted transcriptional regulator